MELLIKNYIPSNTDASNRIWKYSEKPATYTKFVQFNHKSIQDEIVSEQIVQDIHTAKMASVIERTDDTTKTSQTSCKIANLPKKKVVKQRPHDILIQLSECNDMEYIKEQMNSFISKNDFNIAFGMKKTSEIMTGITENKWNKSLAIFLSFLFDVSFVYLNKEVVFNAEKTKQKIII